MSISENLLRKYQDQWALTRHPKWAFDVVPAVPLVGESFVAGKGLLVYGSAENLSGDIAERGYVKTNFNRHRHYLDQWKQDPEDRPFPDMHCQPITSGGLLVAAAFLLTLEGRTVPDSPGTFIESLAVGNFGKFAVQGATNSDYANDGEKLRASLEYIKADLTLLRPAVVLMPRTIWQQPEIQEALAGVRGPSFIVGAYQCQPQPINTHLIKKHGARAVSLQGEHHDAPWRSWCGKLLGGLGEANIWHYLAHIEECWTRARAEQA